MDEGLCKLRRGESRCTPLPVAPALERHKHVGRLMKAGNKRNKADKVIRSATGHLVAAHKPHIGLRREIWWNKEAELTRLQRTRAVFMACSWIHSYKLIMQIFTAYIISFWITSINRSVENSTFLEYIFFYSWCMPVLLQTELTNYIDYRAFDGQKRSKNSFFFYNIDTLFWTQTRTNHLWSWRVCVLIIICIIMHPALLGILHVFRCQRVKLEQKSSGLTWLSVITWKFVPPTLL